MEEQEARLMNGVEESSRPADECSTSRTQTYRTWKPGHHGPSCTAALSAVNIVVAIFLSNPPNFALLRARLASGAQAMNNAVQTGEIQKVVENGKALEIASSQLREAETTIAHMDIAE